MITFANVAITLLTLSAVLSALAATTRLVRGSRNADRVVALDIFLASAIALCIAASLGSGRTVFLDVAIGLSLVSFIGTIGWAQLIERSADLPKQKDKP